MNINGKHYRTIREKSGDSTVIQIIDQRSLPHIFEIAELKTVDGIVAAIKDMAVRGAPLIGAAAAYGMYLASLEALKASDFGKFISESAVKLKNARPTAVNLSWAVECVLSKISEYEEPNQKIKAALETARFITEDDVERCRNIGRHGVKLIEDISEAKNGEAVNILTHCNAGWLATVDFGTATAPIYEAYERGIDIHVWVDETRPRNQGARLTAFELSQQGVPNTLIADNTGGHLMQHGLVDIVIVGSDRTSRRGDVANKIGTYLKALAAKDNDIPFYVALPSSTIDWSISDGITEIPIENRSPDEVKYIEGLNAGEIKSVLISEFNCHAANYAFDVTPARLVTGLITERGIAKAQEDDIMKLFPEKTIY